MKESKVYALSLSLPLVVPVLFAALMYFDPPFPKWLQTFMVYNVASGLVGGIPYLVLVVLLFWWGRGKSSAQFKRALVLSPILMLPVFFLILVIFSLISGSFRGEGAGVEDLKMLLLYFSFIIGFGYFYVLLVFGIVFLLKRLGVVTSSPTSYLSLAVAGATEYLTAT